MNKSSMDTLKTLEIYAWIDRCLFPADFAEELTKLGMDNVLARDFTMSLFRNKKLNIVSCFQYFNGCTDKAYEATQKQILSAYVDKMIKEYNS